MIVRGAFNHLLRPGLRRDFRDSYTQFPQEYGSFLKVGSQDRAEIEAVTLSGLPRQVARGEVEPITYIDPVMSDKVIFIDDEFALGFQISKRTVEDDQYGKANQNSKWLGRSVRLTQEFAAAELLDDAFDGNVFTGFAGEELCDATHTLLNSASTTSNVIAGAPQLGVTGLQAAFEMAELTVDHQNDPIPVMINKLIISVADEWVAIQLTNGTLEPFTSDNQVNATLKKRPGLSYMVSHYKTQNGNWFAQDSSLIDSHFLFRVRPQFMDTFDFDTLAAKFASRQRINVYFYDWRGWIGSAAP
jgi:hypothetical protein